MQLPPHDPDLVGRIDGAMSGQSSPPPESDHVIARVAARQHGLVTRAQLLKVGLSPWMIDRRIAAGRLHAVHRGVYAVGHPLLTRRGRELAAVMACGPGAVLSHQSAAALLGLMSWGGRIHVTAPRSRGAHGRVVVHRSRGPHPDEIARGEGIACTSWARTLLDLGAVLPVPKLVRALEASVIEELYDHTHLLDVLGRSSGHHGAGKLRKAIARGHHLDPARTRSMLEEAFLDLVRRSSRELPAPRMNAWLVLSESETYEIDALWSRERLAIELDSRRYHSHAGALESDAARDASLRRHGYSVLRLTWWDVTLRPAVVRRRIQQTLGRLDSD